MVVVIDNIEYLPARVVSALNLPPVIAWKMTTAYFDLVKDEPPADQVQYLRWAVDVEATLGELRAYVRAHKGEDLSA